jgi:hypothetical protein
VFFTSQQQSTGSYSPCYVTYACEIKFLDYSIQDICVCVCVCVRSYERGGNA